MGTPEAMNLDTKGQEVTFRSLCPEDLLPLYQLIEGTRWNVTLEDITLMQTHMPAGFMGAFSADGALIGNIGLFNWNDQLAYIGVFIVDPKYRKQGIGRSLFEHAMVKAGQRAVCLDSVPRQPTLYKASGFQEFFIMHKMTGDIQPRAPPGDSREEWRLHAELVKITPDKMAAVLSYDAFISLTDRSRFLAPWISSRETISRCAVSKSSGSILGFILLRPSRDRGWRASCFYADDDVIAKALLRGAISDLPDVETKVSCYVPEANDSAEGVYKEMNITRDPSGYWNTRMVKGRRNADFQWNRVYCTCNTYCTYI